MVFRMVVSGIFPNKIYQIDNQKTRTKKKKRLYKERMQERLRNLKETNNE